MRIRQKAFQAGSFFTHWLKAVNEHSLHPPFVFNLYARVLKPGNPLPEAAEIEARRRKLCHNHSLLNINDLGAGSSLTGSSLTGSSLTSGRQRKISEVARHSLTRPRFSQMLYRLIRFMKARNILELGTSLGINTLYLSAASPAGKVFTLEGCPHTAGVARNLFEEWPVQNILLKEGNIDHTLPELLAGGISKIDGVYIDANHTYQATIRYFETLLPYLHEKSFVVVDDIYWSPGMKKAWLEMQQHEDVRMSLDLFQAGILIFQPGLQKEHYILEF